MSDREPSAGVWDADRIHRLPVRVYFEDTDFSQIVYHARYLHFFERGRTESLRALGVHHGELIKADDPVAFAVRSMDIQWIRPAQIDDALIVETLYRPNKGPRLRMEQSIHRGDEMLCSAKVEAVIIDPAGRPRRPPGWMIDIWTPVVHAFD